MNERIRVLITRLKKEHGTLDPFQIITEKELGLKYVHFPSEVLGRYMKTFSRPTIFLNESLESSNQRYFVASHELCHALEHEELSGYYVFNHRSRSKLENEANVFATTLLFNFYMEEHETYPRTSQSLKYTYGVPTEYSELFLKL
jgi:Zn-dependent peptidase ImmA (M78 family)